MFNNCSTMKRKRNPQICPKKQQLDNNRFHVLQATKKNTKTTIKPTHNSVIGEFIQQEQDDEYGYDDQSDASR